MKSALDISTQPKQSAKQRREIELADMEELRKLEQVQSVLMFMQSREFLDSSNLDSSRFLANLILLLSAPVISTLPKQSARQRRETEPANMEELRKLEQVQSVLMFMQSREFVDSSNLDSSRFLANLILLLVQPCGELDIGEKCSLISEYVPKISAAFLKEASQWLGLKTVLHSEGKQDNRAFAGYQQNHVHGTKIGKRHCDSLQVKEKDVAMVGLDAMERANSTLEDFCRSYFMFHGVDINTPQSLFKYLPLLTFVESYMYQLDGLNEEILHIATEEVPGLERGSKEIVDQGRRTKFNDAFETDPFKPLVGLLKCRDLLTERIIEEFRGGEEYWALERKLCCAVIGNKEISIEDSLRAIHLKSFDYRVLNLLLYQLRGEEVNDLHMEFLSVSEFLVEISDDL
ncbi:hypothetical protein SLEP1_g33172 [Rubroshorea leprosula]|uniref:Uncharacterized protein n=1 Tax=Rubroshorea leprosula TaxID=152421 RepID=A0AAV5KFR6_9ROSI|nr:hypothetical protein SLEP1_g33172 [Rubroshorea leprosula]